MIITLIQTRKHQLIKRLRKGFDYLQVIFLAAFLLMILADLLRILDFMWYILIPFLIAPITYYLLLLLWPNKFVFEEIGTIQLNTDSIKIGSKADEEKILTLSSIQQITFRFSNFVGHPNDPYIPVLSNARGGENYLDIKYSTESFLFEIFLKNVTQRRLLERTLKHYEKKGIDIVFVK